MACNSGPDIWRLARRTSGICPVRQVLVADAAKGRVEVVLANEEGIVLGCDRRGGLSEVQRDAIVGLDDEKMREPGRRRQAKDPGQERRRPPLVAAGDDGVVQLHAHQVIVPSVLASENLVTGYHERRRRGLLVPDLPCILWLSGGPPHLGRGAL